MAFTPMPVVAAPAPRGLRYGLLTAAAGPLDLPPHAVGSGIRYEPTTCGRSRLYPVECPADVDPTEKILDPADPFVDAEAFVVYSTLQCTSVGTTGSEMEARVRRRLANGEQLVAEEGMATALAAGATPVTPADPDSIRGVVGELEQWLYGTATAGYGNVGYLHAPTRYAGYASAAGLAVKDGPLLRTVLGTIWIFGGGYPDDGTFYISGQVTVWRTPEPLVPPADQTFNRSTNQYLLLAEREYAVAYDCVAAAAQYTGDVAIS